MPGAGGAQRRRGARGAAARHVTSLTELDVDDLRSIYVEPPPVSAVDDRLTRLFRPPVRGNISGIDCASVDVTRITQRCGRNAPWPVRVPPSTSRRSITDEDFSSGGTAIRIASVAALGGLLFGYDSAVINGAVESIQEEFGIGNAELGFAVASALLGAAAGAMTAGRIADKIGRIAVMKIAAVLFFISAIGTGFAPEVWTVVVFRDRRRHRRRRRLGDRARLHRRDLAAAHPRPAGLAAAAGDRVRHLPVVRHQLRCLQTIAGGAERGAVARARGVALDVPGDGDARRRLRLAGVHHPGVAALSGCQPQDSGGAQGAHHAARREEPRDHHRPDPGDAGARGQAVAGGTCASRPAASTASSGSASGCRSSSSSSAST